jgi:hypothetical protein
MLEKNEGTIKKGQSEYTGNIGYTRHSTKTNKKKYNTENKNEKSNKDPTKHRG